VSAIDPTNITRMETTMRTSRNIRLYQTAASRVAFNASRGRVLRQKRYTPPPGNNRSDVTTQSKAWPAPQPLESGVPHCPKVSRGRSEKPGSNGNRHRSKHPDGIFGEQERRDEPECDGASGY
jgi:hypothetical protein